MAVFVVGAGEGVRERSQAAKEAGEYLASHAIQALAIETAEAAAEWLHGRIRGQWGFPDPPEMTMKDRFAARYRGKRFSFGYPACPDLDDQAASVAAAATGRDRRRAHRRHDDGAGGERLGTCVSSPRRQVLLGLRRRADGDRQFRISDFGIATEISRSHARSK